MTRSRFPGYDYWELLRANYNYRSLFAARSISLLGDWLNTIAVFVLLESMVDGGAAAFGWVLMIKFLPNALLASWAGVIADRYDRKVVMILSDVSRALVVCGFLLVHIWPSSALVFSVLAVQAALGTFFEPARNALLPDVVQGKELVTANALGAIVWSLMLTLGSAIGGVLTEVLGWEFVILGDALSYLLSAYYVSKIHTHVAPSQKDDTKEAKTQDFREALRYLRRSPTVRALTFIKGTFSIGAAFGLLLAVFGAEVYTLGETAALGISLLYAARGLGTGCGPVISRWMSRSEPEAMRGLILPSYALIAVCYSAFSFTHTLWLAVVFVFIAHLGGSTIWVFSTVLLQQEVVEEYRGRVFGIEMAAFTTTISVSILFFSQMIELHYLDPHSAVRLLSGSMSIPALYWFFSLRHWKKQRLSSS